MMIKIYGRYSNDLLRRILQDNPRIRDPGQIPAGQEIRFPAIVAALTPGTDRGGCWVQLGEYEHLETALKALRQYPRGAPTARLVPWWTPETGLRFTLALWQRFADQAEALRQMEALPDGVDRNGRVLLGWNARAVFFADPRQER